jgi:hypothetical protein
MSKKNFFVIKWLRLILQFQHQTIPNLEFLFWIKNGYWKTDNLSLGHFLIIWMQHYVVWYSDIHRIDFLDNSNTW